MKTPVLTSLIFTSALLAAETYAIGDSRMENRMNSNTTKETTGVQQFKDVESLMDKVDEVKNRQVKVTGEVKEKKNRSFVLESGGVVNDEILVFLGKNLENS